jgi:hypothetical protein
MSQVAFPVAMDVVRHLLPTNPADRSAMRCYAKANDFVHRFWPAMSSAAAQAGSAVSEELYERMKTLDGITDFIASGQDGLACDALEDYLQDLPRAQQERDVAHTQVLAQVDAAVLAALPPHEVYRRFERAKSEAKKGMDAAHSLATAIDEYVAAQEGAMPSVPAARADAAAGHVARARGLDRALDALLGARRLVADPIQRSAARNFEGAGLG